MPTINLTITDTAPNLVAAQETLEAYMTPPRQVGETDTQFAQRWLDGLYAALPLHGFTWALFPSEEFRTNLVAAVIDSGFPKINGENDSKFLRRWIIKVAKGVEKGYRRGLVAEDDSGMV